MKKWQFQEAKAKLSEVIKNATNIGPQEITVRGKTTAIIISSEKYRELTNPKSSFLDFITASPLVGLNIDLERMKSSAREVEL